MQNFKALGQLLLEKTRAKREGRGIMQCDGDRNTIYLISQVLLFCLLVGLWQQRNYFLGLLAFGRHIQTRRLWRPAWYPLCSLLAQLDPTWPLLVPLESI